MSDDTTTQSPDGKKDSSQSFSSVGRVLGMRDTLRQDREKAEALEPEALTPPKLTPAPSQTPPSNPMLAFGQPAMWLAIFGSLATRQHLTAAVTSAAAVLQATQKLDAQAAQQNYAQWKVNSENAIKTAKYVQDAYKAAIAKIGADSRAASAEVGTLAKAFKDDAMLKIYEKEGMDGVVRFVKGRGKQLGEAESGSSELGVHIEKQISSVKQISDALSSGDPTKVADALDAQAGVIHNANKSKKATPSGLVTASFQEIQLMGAANKIRSGDPAKMAEGLEEASKILNVGIAALKPSASGGTALAAATPEEKSSLGAMVATGMPLSQAVPGYGTAAVAARKDALNEAIGQIMKETGLSAKDAGTELANRNIEYAAGRRSSTQLTTMLGATKQAMSQLDFNIEKTKEEMKKLGSTDISPIINGIIRGQQKWTGDPAYSALFYYMHATAVESARILSGGQASIAQLQQGAMEEAKKWADAGMTPASFDAVAKAMREEGQNRLQTFGGALSSQKLTGRGQVPSLGATPERPPATGARKAPDGQWYVPDPNRPGKYLMVNPGG